ncbi:hypothetical protein [Micromonospora cathayae]|uniref:Uncharacterized protein n=1 Tax=Micromonospora cathayae TaxID=3028804 RepID=A0ABY7ZZE4_9ACTN|nr:hypothetical protein [Micromonospora sp. HUAS 3]WDZ88275.1 hypothetical protein PVK37_18995 [Micromonospora sp. HUAS 3]
MTRARQREEPVSEPEENQDEADRTEPIVAAPTANPARVQVPPEGPEALADGVRPPEPGPVPGEET